MKAFSCTGLVFSATTKLAVTLCSSALALAACAQGVVTFVNTSATLARTNAIGVGGTAGNTATNPGSFFYAVFTAPSTVTSLSAMDLSSGTWTFTGIYATNTGATTGGRLSGGAGVATQSGWPYYTTNSFVVVGWSARVAGPDWNAVAGQLSGASLQNGVWTGPGWLPASAGGFFGLSPVGVGAAVPPPPLYDLPPFNLFGPSPTPLGTPISTGFDLFVVNTPEPSVWILAVFGSTTLAAFSRRKII